MRQQRCLKTTTCRRHDQIPQRSSSSLKLLQHLLQSLLSRIVASAQHPYSSPHATFRSTVLTITVPSYQECSSSRRCLWQRYFQQLPSLCPPRLRAMVLGSLRPWRLVDHAPLLPIHINPDLDVLLDNCLKHITSQERESSIPWPSSRVVSVLPVRR